MTAASTKADIPDTLKTVLADSNPMTDFRKAIGPLSPSTKYDLADVSKRVGVGALRTVFNLFLLFLAFYVMASLIRMTAAATSFYASLARLSRPLRFKRGLCTVAAAVAVAPVPNDSNAQPPANRTFWISLTVGLSGTRQWAIACATRSKSV